jgi:5,10-methenyltetrahydrofolate synthetase
MNGKDGLSWDEIRAWRKVERQALVSRRAATDQSERNAWNDAITARLVEGFGMPEEVIVGYCWPYKGEFDARYAVRRWREQGAVAALPEVVASKTPLQFRKWWPGAPMKPGVYDIPVPDGTDIVMPDVAIVPMNASDERGFRLGYGGGFFDRTLAACGRRMVAIGVTYEMLRVPTIHPQPHDIPMDFVVTEAAIYAAGGEPLASLDAPASRQAFARLLDARGLPREAWRTRGYSSPACYAAEFPEYFSSEDVTKKEVTKNSDEKE